MNVTQEFKTWSEEDKKALKELRKNDMPQDTSLSDAIKAVTPDKK